MKMKKIICYGDSNTFGYSPKDGIRFDENTRWTGVLQKILGAGYEVINEGACDRTGFVNNPKGGLFSAPVHFPEFIVRVENFDLLILWIGTNDLQFQYDISGEVIEKGLENLIKQAKTKAKNIIVIPPVILTEKVLAGYFSYQFDETSVAKSKEAGKIFRQVAENNHCSFFDINEFTSPSDFDGLHYDENSHRLIAEKLTAHIRENIL